MSSNKDKLKLVKGRLEGSKLILLTNNFIKDIMNLLFVFSFLADILLCSPIKISK